MLNLGELITAIDKERRMYAATTLPLHLARAHQFKRLNELLLNGQFIRVKLAYCRLQMLIDDYDLALFSPIQSSSALLEVQNALRSSSHVLSVSTDQLAPQLFGRLLHRGLPEIDSLLEQLKPSATWFRPLSPSLISSRSLVRTFRHSKAVYGLAVTPDCRYVIGGSYSIRVWDAMNGDQMFEIPATGSLVMELLVASEHIHSQQFVAVHQNGTVRILDWRTGVETGSFKTLGGVKAAAITSDGRFLICAPDALCIEIWDLNNYTLVGQLEDPKAPKLFISDQMAQAGFWEWDGRGHRKTINCLALSHDDKYLYSGSDDRQLIVWEIPGGSVIWQHSYHAGVKAVVEAAPGLVIFALDDGTIWGHLTRTSQEAFAIGQHANVRSLAVSYNNSLLASGAADGSIRLWHLEERCEVRDITGDVERRSDTILHRDITKLIMMPGTDTVISASADNAVRLWRAQGIATKQNIDSPETAEPLYSYRAQDHLISQDGWTLLTSSNRNVTVIGLHDGDVQTHFRDFDGDVSALAITPHGRTFAAGCRNGNLITGTVGESDINVTSISHEPISGLTLSANGRCAFVGLKDGGLVFVDLHTSEKLRTLTRGPAMVNKLMLGSGGELLFSASTDEPLICAWDVRTGALIKTMKQFNGRSPAGILRLRVTPEKNDITYIHYSQDSTSVGRWDPFDASLSFRLDIRKGNLYAISHCGRWAALETREHCVQLFDLMRPSRWRLLDGHYDYLTSIEFTADSSQVVTSSAGGEVAIWRLDGHLLRKFKIGGGPVEDAKMTPDGAALICGSNDGSLSLWEMQRGSCVATFSADAPIWPRHITPDGRTLLATDALCGVHLLRIENLKGTGQLLIPATPPARTRVSRARRFQAWLQWRWHFRRGAAASELRDWSTAEREYRAAAICGEVLDSNEKLDDTLDRLEFVIGMRKLRKT